MNEHPNVKSKKRLLRKLVKTFLVMCEGNAELNYFKGINENLPIKLTPINLKGERYKTYLKLSQKYILY